MCATLVGHFFCFFFLGGGLQLFILPTQWKDFYAKLAKRRVSTTVPFLGEKKIDTHKTSLD